MLPAQIDAELARFVAEMMVPVPSASTRACKVWEGFTQWLLKVPGANEVSKTAVARSLRRLGYQMARGRDGMHIIGLVIRANNNQSPGASPVNVVSPACINSTLYTPAFISHDQSAQLLTTFMEKHAKVSERSVLPVRDLWQAFEMDILPSQSRSKTPTTFVRTLRELGYRIERRYVGIAVIGIALQ